MDETHGGVMDITQDSRCMMGSPPMKTDAKGVLSQLSPESSRIDKSQLFCMSGLNSTMNDNKLVNAPLKDVFKK